MRLTRLLLIFFFVTAISFAQKSPKKQTEGNINNVMIAVDYGAPSVKERTIWGNLVKYDKVWRAGANENTIISFDKDVTINGKKLSAGKYGFFMIPKETGNWTIIFSKKSDAWGHFSYKEKNDALRVEITPEFGNDVQEQLLYSINKDAIIITWDKAKIAIPVK